MQAVWYEELGPAEKVLKYGEMPDPAPAAGDVRVAVQCSGVNPIDVKRRQGGRGTMSAPRIIPHFDGAGTIDAVGAGVDPQRIGQRVWIYGAQWQRDFGAAADFVILPHEMAVPLPDHTDFAEGACLGIPGLTAYAAVFYDGDVANQNLMVTGGAGAVGRYAVQFAKLSGARVISTVSTDEKAALASSAGADEIVNYRQEDVARRVREITDGAGVDRIVEVEFGGNLATSLKILRIGGTIATYASQADPTPTVPFYDLMYRSVVVRHVLVFQMPEQLMQRAVRDISDWLQQRKLTHHLGPRFSLADTVAAHHAVEQGAVGKVLVENTRS